MAHPPRVRRIGVFGHVGDENLGDEALIAAVIENVRRRHPGAEVVGFTTRPADTEARHRIPAVPIRRLRESASRVPPASASAQGEAMPPGSGVWKGLKASLKRVPLLPLVVRSVRQAGRVAVDIPAELAFLGQCYRNLRGTDLLCIAGSAQLNDYWGGPWAYPFTLFTWSLLARLTGTKVAFLSLGAGPLRTRLGKFFIKYALRWASYRSYRDADSQRCVLQLGAAGAVVPDLVFSLHIEAPPVMRGTERTVAINPMPVFDDLYWPERDARSYRGYVDTLAAFADWLVERGYRVRLFPTQLKVDPRVIADVRQRMRAAGTDNGCVSEARIGSFEQLVTAISAADFVVATRYHGTLFALLLGKPVLSIAYQTKSTELMAQVAQRDHAIDLKELTLDQLQQRFLSLERCGDGFAAAVCRRLPEVRATLARQYDDALALVSGPS